MILAYIDPGTGSLLLSGLVGISFTLAYSLRGLVYRIVSQIVGKRVGVLPDFGGKLVFYSEGSKYWKVFKPVLDELCRANESYVYLTSDLQDPALNYEDPAKQRSGGRAYYYIGRMHHAIPFLNKLRAQLVVMTTPQLGILQWKRSKDVQHYAHLVHAPVDCHTYKFYAFDLFDSVLCSSRFQIENLRELEALRNTRKKQLFETGCTYYDEARVCLNTEAIEHESILYAPTWGDKSSLLVAKELLQQLIVSKYTVIFRPHPQSLASDAAIIKDLQEYFAAEIHSGALQLDFDPGSQDSFARCVAMICDFSGVIYDFVFLYRKPIFAFAMQWAKEGYEAYYLHQPISACELLEQTGGKLIAKDDIASIGMLLENSQNATFSAAITEKFVFHFQQAGPVAAQQILALKAAQV